MKKSIFVSGIVIVLILAFTTVATFAYFSGTDTKTAKITTASIDIGGTSGFQLKFENLLPGESASKEFSLKNLGTREADFYFQMIGDPADNSPPGEMNFCNKSLGKEAVHIWVQELTGSGGNLVKNWVSGVSICDLYPGHGDSLIAKIGNDVGVNSTVFYKATIKLNAEAGNEYNGGSNTDFVNLIAVQFNGPAPMPDKQGFPYDDAPYDWDAWPVDTHAQDDDLNYP
jgi:hypothetical protein